MDLLHRLRPRAHAEERERVIVARVDVHRVAVGRRFEVAQRVIALAALLEERREVVMVGGVGRVLAKLVLKVVRGFLAHLR